MTVQPLSLDQVKALAGKASPPAPAKSASQARRGPAPQFDLERWMPEHGIEVKSIQPYEGGRKFILRVCPFNPEHTGTSAAIFQMADGGIGFKCQHAGCADNNWVKLREKLEPGYRDRRNRYPQHTPPAPGGNGHKPAPEDNEAPFETGFRALYTVDNNQIAWRKSNDIPRSRSATFGLSSTR